MAQTMSLIAATDSREMRAIADSGLSSCPSPCCCLATSLRIAIFVRFAPMSSCKSVAIRVRMFATSNNRVTR